MKHEQLERLEAAHRQLRLLESRLKNALKVILAFPVPSILTTRRCNLISVIC